MSYDAPNPNGGPYTVPHATMILINPATGMAYAADDSKGITDAQLRASDIGVKVSARACLGTQMITALSAVTAASLTIPGGAVVAEIQADGGTVRIRRDAVAPTATSGWRIDDGTSVTVDSALASVRLLAQSGTATNVQIAYFDRV